MMEITFIFKRLNDSVKYGKIVLDVLNNNKGVDMIVRKYLHDCGLRDDTFVGVLGCSDICCSKYDKEIFDLYIEYDKKYFYYMNRMFTYSKKNGLMDFSEEVV